MNTNCLAEVMVSPYVATPIATVSPFCALVSAAPMVLNGKRSLPTSLSLSGASAGFTTHRCLGPTVIVAVPVTPGATVAVRVVVPFDTAAMAPVESTLATAVLDELQMKCVALRRAPPDDNTLADA